ncbi:hypothetical protein JCM10450v2_005490 [Rhodotorula kratochvilovae]
MTAPDTSTAPTTLPDSPCKGDPANDPDGAVRSATTRESASSCDVLALLLLYAHALLAAFEKAFLVGAALPLPSLPSSSKRNSHSHHRTSSASRFLTYPRRWTSRRRSSVTAAVCYSPQARSAELDPFADLDLPALVDQPVDINEGEGMDVVDETEEGDEELGIQPEMVTIQAEDVQRGGGADFSKRTSGIFVEQVVVEEVVVVSAAG